MQPLVGVAADRDGGECADADADRDAFQQRTRTVLAGRRLRQAGGREMRVDAGVYLLFDFLQEGRHHGVAVLRPQLIVGCGAGSSRSAGQKAPGA